MLGRRCAGPVPILLSMLLFACPAQAEQAAAFVPVVNGEDLAPVEGGRWVLASSMAGPGRQAGEIVAISTRTEAVRPVYPSRRGAPKRPAPGSACAGPDPTFKPHGIWLRSNGRGAETLLVVNHGTREGIEVLELDRGRHAPRLRWIGCLPLPPDTVGNAVVAASGRIFATAHRPSDRRAGAVWGEVIEWKEGRGWVAIPGSALAAPSGLLATADASRLYISSWSDQKLVELHLGPARPVRRELPLSFRPDNLQWSRDGRLLVTGQAAEAEAVIACGRSLELPCRPRVPGATAEVDATSMTVRCSHSVELDGATLAVDVGSQRWFGTYRGTVVLRTKRPHC